MAELTLRPFNAEDSTHLSAWYEEDREGFEQLLGIAVPDTLACTLAFNTLLQQQQTGQTFVQTIDRGDAPIGLAILTEISPDQTVARPHLYIAPSQRRYSLRAAKIAEDWAKNAGFTGFYTTVRGDNRRALSLARRLGYQGQTQVILMKELEAWDNFSPPPTPSP